MGRGSYTAQDWNKLKNAKGLVSHRAPEKIFVSGNVKSIYDVYDISVRESRDSSDAPQSTPVIIGFDVTGSMGYLAKELAVNAVNRTVMTLLTRQAVSNPHIMCCAIGDCKSDSSPLQATQFEADIRIIQQLLELYLEGGGGGNNGESYNLLWYFAARHTQHDCFSKRGKKGFLFTIGDDRCHSELGASEIARVFGDAVPYSVFNEELLAEVQKKYHVVHIHIENNTTDDEEIFAQWMRLMPGRALRINKKDIECLSTVITTAVAVLSGVSVNEVLKAEDPFIAEQISASIALLKLENEKKNIIF